MTRSIRTSRCGLFAALALALLALCVPPASAASLAPRTLTQPVTLMSTGAGLGSMTFTTTYSTAGATGTARASSVRLTSGRTYRLQSCVWSKAQMQAPVSSCASKIVKLGRFTTSTAAPTAQLAVARPAAGQVSATIAGAVLVDIQDAAGRWSANASSWPAAGMPAAGVAVPAVDQTTGTVLGPQGTLLSGVRQGGINTGAQDSICQGTDTSTSAAPQGSTTALGELPAPYEVGEPLGRYSGARAHGVMIVLHGGTWQMHGRGAMESTRGDVDRWRARGWRTVMGDHRPCGDSIGDVLALYDRVRAVYGAAKPVCVSGQSSGAHLALLLAALRPDVACVISQAGPADLTTLAYQAATKPDGTPSAVIPLQLSNVTVSAFGADRLADMSPARLGVAGRVLFAIAASDPGIPWAQATGFAAAQTARNPTAYVDTMRLPNGGATWVHADVSPAGLASFHEHEKLLVTPFTNGGLQLISKLRLRTLRRRGLQLVYTCPGACAVSAQASLDRRTARRLRLRGSLGKAAGGRAAYGTSGLVIRLGTRARARLRSRSTLRVVLRMRSDGVTRSYRAGVRVR